MMTDRILAVLSILGLLAYFLPLILLVAEPALVVILCMVIAMAAFDFWLELSGSKKKHEGLQDIL